MNRRREAEQMSRFEDAKKKLRNVGAEEEPEGDLAEMQQMWQENKHRGSSGGETPMKQHHKDAEGCGRSVGFQFSEDRQVPGDDKGDAGSWADILDREGKRKGTPLFSFDQSGKPIVNARVEPPPGH
jgi:hypothetical protein